MVQIRKGIKILVRDGPTEFFSRFTSYVKYFLQESIYKLLAYLLNWLDYSSHILDTEDTISISSEFYELNETSELPNPEEQINLNPLKSSDYLETHLQPIFLFKSPFVAVLSEMTTAGVNGLAYTKNGDIIGETVDFDIKNEFFRHNRIQRCLIQDIIHNPFLISRLFLTGEIAKTDQYYSHAAIIHGKSHTYYQWMIYHLPKLRGIEFYSNKTGNDVHLLIPSDPPSYVIESLELLGYGPNDYTQWDKKAAYVDKLIVPSFPEPTPETIEWLRNKMSPDNQINKKEGGWIYISRQNSGTRKISNFDELKPILNEYGVKIVELEEFSVHEQIKIVRNSDGIIGPHGAGLINMIWAKNISVIEIFGDVVDAPYFIIANILNHDYSAISGHQANPWETDRNANIVVDIEEIKNLLGSKIETEYN